MKIFGIIGDPIRHSLSPAMQNAAFRSKKIRAIYLPFHVRKNGLRSFIRRISKLGLAGLNVTVPHKEAVVRTLDKISPSAQRIGAVNTIIVRGKKLYGENTDAQGYLRSLKEIRFQTRGKTVLILGAGGAARAVLEAMLTSRVSSVYIANRTASRARKLVRHFEKHRGKTKLGTIPFDRKNLAKFFPQIDLLINATSVGLEGSRFEKLPLSHLKKTCLVSDLVYRPTMTPLIREARKRGFKTLDGLGLLLHQGAISFKLWTGKQPSLRVMDEALRRKR